MFTKTQRFYDLVYSWKDYQADAARLHELIESRKRSAGNRLLDVACGTGKHMELLLDQYRVEGLDLDPVMLEIARQRLPAVELHEGDFRDFDLGRHYDVVTCLFSSIAYAEGTDQLRQAVATMARHLEPGGVLIVEPFFNRSQFREGHVQMTCSEDKLLKVTRMASTRLVDGGAELDFHYLVGEAGSVEHILEKHRASLFDDDDYVAAFSAAGLEVEHDEKGLMGRGLFIGIKPFE